MLGIIVLFMFFWVSLIALAIYIRCQEFQYAIIIQWRYICNLLEKRTTLIGELVITAMDTKFPDRQLITTMQNHRMGGDNIYSVLDRGQFERKLEALAEDFLVELLAHSPNAVRPLEAKYEDLNAHIAKARKDYNALVKEMNRFMLTMPECFLARMMGFTEPNFFQIETAYEIEQLPPSAI